MSRIRADRIVDRVSTGAPLFPNGAVITGVATATTFSGALSGNATSATTATTATTATNAQGLTGSPNITVNNIVGAAATFTGVLTYEDVTNVDSVGIVTARGGLTTQKLLKEEVNVVANKLSAANNIDLENGCVHLFTTQETTTSTPNLRYNGSTSLNSKMSIGESVVLTIITTAAAGGYSANLTIGGGSNRTIRWIGGSAPSGGGSSGVDIHTYTIIKTADDTFTIIGNHSKTS